jgi:integrase/recombinase XerD
MTADLTALDALPSDHLPHAVTAYLSRYKGLSSEHTHSDLRVFLTWCTGQDLDPLTVRRHRLELYVRWLQRGPRVQAVDRLAPHLSGRRFPPHLRHRRGPGPFPGRISAAPTVSAESPTLGLTHLQFEPLLFAARQSADRHDFALVVMLGLAVVRRLRQRQVGGSPATPVSPSTTWGLPSKAPH